MRIGRGKTQRHIYKVKGVQEDTVTNVEKMSDAAPVKNPTDDEPLPHLDLPIQLLIVQNGENKVGTPRNQGLLRNLRHT